MSHDMKMKCVGCSRRGHLHTLSIIGSGVFVSTTDFCLQDAPLEDRALPNTIKLGTPTGRLSRRLTSPLTAISFSYSGGVVMKKNISLLTGKMLVATTFLSLTSRRSCASVAIPPRYRNRSRDTVLDNIRVGRGNNLHP